MFASFLAVTVSASLGSAQPAPGGFLVLEAQGLRSSAFPVGVLTGAEAGILQLRSTTLLVPGFPKEAHAILANGDRVCGRIAGGDARRFLLKTPYAAADASIPVSRTAAVWWVGPAEELPADPARYPFLAGPKRDSILLADRDVRGGLIERIGADGLTLRRDDKAEAIAAEQLRAVVFDPSLQRDRKPAGAAVKATLRDGSRLTFGDLTSDGKTLTGKTVWGASLAIPAGDVCTLERLGTPGAELEAALTIEPYFGAGLVPSANRTPDGRLFRLPSWGVVDRGYRLPAGSTATFKLDGKFRKWHAHFGIESDAHGSAEVRVDLDGKALPVNDGTPLLPGTLVAAAFDVSGGKELRVRIVVGRVGNAQARVVLAAPFAVE